MKKENGKKISGIIKTVCFVTVVAFAVFMTVFTLISVTLLDKNDRGLFGIRLYNVLSDSMSKTDFAAGDVIVSVKTDPDKLKEGDIITFQSVDPDNFGETVTHKIREIKIGGNGEKSFVTYGTTTGINDGTPVTSEFVLGKYCFKIPKAGSFFHYIKTPPGYVCFVLLPFLLIIGFQTFSCVKTFGKYKKEQLEEINAERASLEAELEEARRRLKEMESKKEASGEGSDNQDDR